MTNLKNKWALVTGANRGIGYLTAVFMAKQGCNLILHAREISKLDALLQEVKAIGVEAIAVSADLSDVAQIEKMLSEIDEKVDNVEVILNNAGFQIAYRTDYCKTPANDYMESFKTNTVAPMMICYHYLPKMIENGFGRIVNTTSGIALEPEQAGYSASKAALDKVTIDIGSKLQGTDVIISLADPGWCSTELGGVNAPNKPESTIPGIVVGAFVNDKKSGRFFSAQDFKDLSLECAVEKAESINSPY